MPDMVSLRFHDAGLIRAVKAADGARVLEVLGVPFGGPEPGGRDRDGETFTKDTDLWLAVGDSRPAVYYHGMTPTGERDPDPKVVGMATVIRVDERGWWFQVPLPPEGESPEADRVWDAAQQGMARASSGAIGYLVRTTPQGIIRLWPLGELSLIDEDPEAMRLPSNEWAVALPMKALTERFNSLGITMPEAFTKAGEAGVDAVATDPEAEAEVSDEAGEIQPLATTPNVEGINMDENEKAGLVTAAAEAVLAALDKREADKADKAAEREAIKAELRKEVEAEFVPARKGGFYVKRHTSLGLKDDQTKAFMHWVRTGDETPVKAAGLAMKLGANELVEADSDASGGYFLVPEDWRTRIIEKRDEASIARAMGAMVIQTSSDVVKFPVEGTAQAEFGIVAEEGSHIAQLDNPVVGQEPCTIYKFSKTVKVTEELIEDTAANLEDYLIRSFARKQALTENKYVLTGTGTGQPEGVTVGGQSGLTAASGTAITAAEVKTLFYGLGEYRDNCAWTMKAATESAIRSLTGNPFAFDETPGGRMGVAVGTGVLLNKPVFNSTYMATMAINAKPIVIGNWEYYGLAERQGLAIKRLNELYADAGFIGLRATFRFGGQVLQAEAFKYVTMAAA